MRVTCFDEFLISGMRVTCFAHRILLTLSPEYYTWGDPKIPGFVKKNSLKYLYKFETLVPFEVLLLRMGAAIPAPLQMLETLPKIFNGNAVKGRQGAAIPAPLQMLETLPKIFNGNAVKGRQRFAGGP